MRVGGALQLLFLAIFFLVGLCAAGVAEFNLLGVPMLEPSAMHATTGWIALGIVIVCFACGVCVRKLKI
jgi:hypothetical protein